MDVLEAQRFESFGLRAVQWLGSTGRDERVIGDMRNTAPSDAAELEGLSGVIQALAVPTDDREPPDGQDDRG